MMKYELKSNIVELRRREDVQPGCAVTDDALDGATPEILGTFDSLETALAELAKYRSKVEFYEYLPLDFWRVTEYYVEATEVDEDGDFLSNAGIYTAEMMKIPD